MSQGLHGSASSIGRKQERFKVSCRPFVSETSGGSAPRHWISGSALDYPQRATRAVNAKGRSSLFTRTRYQYGSLETKERKKGKEVWEFRYYEPDAQGERQRRAVMVGTREEYRNRVRRKKVSGSAGDLVAAQRRTAERGWCCRFWSSDRSIRARRNAGTVFNQIVVPVVHPEPDQAPLGRYTDERHQADGGRGLAEKLGSRPEDEEPCSKPNAHDFSVC